MFFWGKILFMRSLQFLLISFIAYFPSMVLAVQKNKGLGDIAGEWVRPVGILNNFIGSASLIIGVACLFGAFFRYRLYRMNSLASPLSSVVVLFILGLVLIGLPFLYMILNGVPFTVF